MACNKKAAKNDTPAIPASNEDYIRRLVVEIADHKDKDDSRKTCANCDRCLQIVGFPPAHGLQLDEEEVEEWETDTDIDKLIVPGKRVDAGGLSPLARLHIESRSWLKDAITDADKAAGFKKATATIKPKAEFQLKAYLQEKLAKRYSDAACQTEAQVKVPKRRFVAAKCLNEREQLHLPPCERTRQVISFEALSFPIQMHRPPLGDRLCYMLTDFAAALYCSVAVMCCCTPPHMFR